jgi:hypothetical protein
MTSEEAKLIAEILGEPIPVEESSQERSDADVDPTELEDSLCAAASA